MIAQCNHANGNGWQELFVPGWDEHIKPGADRALVGAVVLAARRRAG